MQDQLDNILISKGCYSYHLITFAVFLDLLSFLPSNKTNEPKAITNVHRLYASCINENAIERTSVNVILSFINTELGGWPILQGSTWNYSTFDFSRLLLKLHEYNKDVIYHINTKIDMINSSVYCIRIFFISILQKQYHSTTDEQRARLFENIRTTIANLSQTVNTNFDFTNYLRRAYLLANVTLVDTDIVFMSEIDFVRNVSLIIDQESPRTLQNYIIWRFIMSQIDNMPNRFRSIKQEFNKIFREITTERPRTITCATYVNNNMGFAVSKLYINKYIDKDARNQVL
ncbi:unnamed protein product [Rotaria sp. Silwood1]|nr:unnamed protein product [Rotaria sp. Silwood1]